ncbi:glycosyltransferase family 4 protein [Pseudomonas sp. CBMAI 2609]|uniref:Glycosyltransferase family 4 protein n=1 Tax=Pseudomonas flavocrustae TaxID=2991719 RepID=A0ABT6IFZ8_9PSED|nr:glycosyltransferase family 1 protein [Pseudomonas sp. CBMAI 2609]MDH4763371.1 glycosyltransferase family 4 protein [Pseudomonas sp. CBMAI 2609]
MKVGLGSTVWSSGVAKGHLDGIGIYTQSLSQAFTSRSDVRIRPYTFGVDTPPLGCGVPVSLAPHFPKFVLKNALLGADREVDQRLANEVDIFHAPDHHIPRLKNVAMVASVMDLIPQIHPEWVTLKLRRLKNWLFNQSVGWADQVITISEYSKRDIVRLLGIAEERVHVTPLGVNGHYFARQSDVVRHEVLHKHGLEPSFFLFVGTLQPRKNLAAVLAAHAQLPETLRKQHPLVVVGRNGWRVETLVEELRALEARGEGKWLEYLPQEEVIALLQSAAALVFMSLFEGFGLPAIEAFAARCPVICSNTTSLPEVVGDAALQADPQEPKAIAQAMLEVLDDPLAARQRVDEGERRARDYTWDACASRTLEVYRLAVQGR